MKIFIKYNTMRDVKVWSSDCSDKTPTTIATAIGKLVIENSGKYVKIREYWFDN